MSASTPPCGDTKRTCSGDSKCTSSVALARKRKKPAAPERFTEYGLKWWRNTGSQKLALRDAAALESRGTQRCAHGCTAPDFYSPVAALETLYVDEEGEQHKTVRYAAVCCVYGFQKLLVQLPAARRCLYEVIRVDRPALFVADIELYIALDASVADRDAEISRRMSALYAALHACLQRVGVPVGSTSIAMFVEGDLARFDSSRSTTDEHDGIRYWKVSKHLYLVAAGDDDTQLVFWERHHETVYSFIHGLYLPETESNDALWWQKPCWDPIELAKTGTRRLVYQRTNVLDKLVYTRNRLMRVCGSRKAGVAHDRGALKPEGMQAQIWFHTLACGPRSCRPSDILVTTERVHEAIRRAGRLTAMPRQVKAAARRKRTCESKIAPLSQPERDAVMDRLEEILRMRGDHTSRVLRLIEEQSGLFDCRQHGPYTCPHQFVHTEDNFRMRLAPDGAVWFVCVSGECKSGPASNETLIGRLRGPARPPETPTIEARDEVEPRVDTRVSSTVPPAIATVPAAAVTTATVTAVASAAAAPAAAAPAHHAACATVVHFSRMHAEVAGNVHAPGRFEPMLIQNEFNLDLRECMTATVDVYDALLAREPPMCCRFHFWLNHQSCMCSQKSQGIKRAIARMRARNPALRVLIIGTRVQFTKSMKQLYPDAALYNDPAFRAGNEALKAAKLLICQYESLHRIMGATYDVIVLDEIEQLCDNAVSAVTNRENMAVNAAVFEHVCKTASRIWATDADLSIKAQLVAKHMGADNVTTWVNRARVLQRTVAVCTQKACWIEAIKDDIKRKQKLGIMLGSRLCGIELEETVLKPAGIRYRYYHSMQDDQMFNDFERLDSVWSDCDVALFTSCVTVSASYNVRGHFDRLYVYATPRSVPPRIVFQMVGRIRNVNSQEVVMFINQPRAHYLTSRLPDMYADVEAAVIARRYVLIRRDDDVQKLLVNVQVDGSTGRLVLQPGWLQQLFVYHELEHNLACNNYLGEVLLRCRELAFPVVCHDGACNFPRLELDNGEAEARERFRQDPSAFDAIDIWSLAPTERAELADQLQQRTKNREASAQDKLTLEKLHHQKHFDIKVSTLR